MVQGALVGIYYLLSTLALAIYLPKIVWDYLFRGKYRGYLAKRLGFTSDLFADSKRAPDSMLEVSAETLSSIKTVPSYVDAVPNQAHKLSRADSLLSRGESAGSDTSLSDLEALGHKTVRGTYRRVLWVHAVSLGEIKGAEPFLREWIKQEPSLCLVLSHGTDTGYKAGGQLIQRLSQLQREHGWEPVIVQHYLPIDTLWNNFRWFHTLRPDLFIMVESDFWPGYIYQAFRRDIPMFIVNAKLSQRSYQRYLYLPAISRLIFGKMTKILCQSLEDADRFQKLGVAPDRVKVMGNLKWDAHIVSPEVISAPVTRGRSVNESMKRLGLLQDLPRPIITLASTHEGEEELLAGALKDLLEQSGGTLLIVPRHPYRFRRVYDFVCRRLSSETSLLTQLDRNERSPSKVYIIDAMGLLLECYSVSDVALVGGSWLPIGGHNILEPMSRGALTFYGPYMFQQKQMHEAAQELGASRQVDRFELTREVMKLLASAPAQEQMRRGGFDIFSKVQGASVRSVATVIESLNAIALSKVVG